MSTSTAAPQCPACGEGVRAPPRPAGRTPTFGAGFWQPSSQALSRWRRCQPPVRGRQCSTGARRRPRGAATTEPTASARWAPRRMQWTS
eukprot:7954917-Pyramimonas_sp.AAC.1